MGPLNFLKVSNTSTSLVCKKQKIKSILNIQQIIFVKTKEICVGLQGVPEVTDPYNHPQGGSQGQLLPELLTLRELPSVKPRLTSKAWSADARRMTTHEMFDDFVKLWTFL